MAMELRSDERGPRIVHGPQSPLVGIVRSCNRIAASDATVLLTGETGTGKEVFARLIHGRSSRAGRPLVAVNCGAIPEALLESELFGHVKGAFTGAMQARRGRIAVAEGGTLFLDEVGELPLSLQVKLLRVLQERSYEPVGASSAVPADFRLVAATNRDLAAEVEAGRFRRDLYYRLLVCPVEVPPLRERHGDVPRLFSHYWLARGEARRVDPELLRALERYDWPGNVRELENLVERLSVCVEGDVISVTDLPPSMRQPRTSAPRRLEVAPALAFAAPLPAALAFAPLPATPTPAVAPPPPPLPAPAFVEPDPYPPYGAEAPLAVNELLAPAPAAHSHSVDPGLHDGRGVDLARILRRLEDAYIDAALARTSGNKKAAADLLGLQRTTLVEKLRRRGRGESGAGAGAA